MKTENTSIRLKKIMTDRKLRQVDILEKCKPFCAKYGITMNKSDISQYVSGKTEPGSKKLTILGLALNVSETWLMGYDVPMERDNNNPSSNSEYTLDDFHYRIGFRTIEQMNNLDGRPAPDLTQTPVTPYAAAPATYLPVIYNPLFGFGIDIFHEKNVSTYRAVPTSVLNSNEKEYYWISAGDISADPNLVPHSSTLLVHRQNEAEDGDLIIVTEGHPWVDELDNCYGKEVKVCRITYHEGNSILFGLPQTMYPHCYGYDDRKEIQIHGKIVKIEIDL